MKARLRAMASSPRAAFGAFVFAVAVFLNQGLPGPEWDAFSARTLADPSHHVLSLLVFPFQFEFARSHDEELYYAAASGIIGAPSPPEYSDRMSASPYFSRVVPADGKWHAPYAEVPIEYPPPAIPFVLLPRLLFSSLRAYAWCFGALMAGCLAAAIAVAIRALGAVGDAPRASRWWLATGLALLEGPLVVERLDAVVALLLAATLLAVVRKRPFSAGIALGFAGATKLVPLLLAPIVFAIDPPTYRTPRGFSRYAGGLLLGFSVGFGPLVASGAAREILGYHLERGLQEEAIAALFDELSTYARTGGPPPLTWDHGARHVHDAVADALAKGSGPLTVAVVLGIAFAFYRKGIPRAMTASALLFATAALWFTGKVFSPQYLTWGIPLAAALPIPSRRVTIPFAIALGITQAYVCAVFREVSRLTPFGMAILTARDVALFVAVYALGLSIVRSEGRGS